MTNKISAGTPDPVLKPLVGLKVDHVRDLDTDAQQGDPDFAAVQAGYTEIVRPWGTRSMVFVAPEDLEDSG